MCRLAFERRKPTRSTPDRGQFTPLPGLKTRRNRAAKNPNSTTVVLLRRSQARTRLRGRSGATVPPQRSRRGHASSARSYGAAGRTLSVRYPVPTVATVETLADLTYQVTWKGDTVVGIDTDEAPLLPLYDRGFA
jgi:hypothetical protein